MPVKAKIYVYAVIAAACWALLYASLNVRHVPLWEWIFFVSLSFFSQIYEIEMTYKRWISSAIIFLVSAIFLFGGEFATLIAALSTSLAEIFLAAETKRGRTSFIKAAFNVSQLVLVIFAGSFLFKAMRGTPPPWTRAVEYIIAINTFFVCKLVNTALVAGIISLTEKVDFFYQFLYDLRHLPLQFFSLGAMTILFAWAYSISIWYVFLVLVPIALIHYSFFGYSKLRRGAEKTFEKLMQSLQARDPYTAEHSERVADLSGKIARKLGLPENEVERIVAAARIHDIGKVGIPDSILLKPGPLTPQEWEIMKKHPVIGAEIIKGMEIYDNCVDIVKYEHERWDGSGYPEGLKGEEIPLGARIVAAADVYDALTSDRPYRKALPKEEAIAELKRMRGVKLDPRVVDALLEVLEEEEKEGEQGKKG